MSTSRVVSLALAAAAGLHLAAFPDHVEEGFVIAGFFLVCAVLQLFAAIVVSAGAGRRARRVVVAGNLAVIALWLVSRTVGLPFGPDAGQPEAISTLDALSFGAELIAVGGLVATARNRRIRAWNVAPVVALAMTSLLVAGAGVAFTPSHYHDEVAHHHDEPVAVHHHSP